MSRRASIGITIAVLGIALVVGGVYFLINIIERNLAPLEITAPTPIPELTEKVLVATHDIPLGALLREQDVIEVDMPITLMPTNALFRVDQAIGRITKVPLVTGELVLAHHLADPTNISNDLAFILGENQVLMAVPPLDLLSSLNVLQRGDVIDIFITVDWAIPVVNEDGEIVLNPETNEPVTSGGLITFDAYQRLVITALIANIIYEERQPTLANPLGTPVPTPAPQPSQVNIQAFLLALDAQDALVLKHLIDKGANFDFVLRNPTSTKFFELTPVTEDYLFDLYGLEKPE